MTPAGYCDASQAEIPVPTSRWAASVALWKEERSVGHGRNVAPMVVWCIDRPIDDCHVSEYFEYSHPPCVSALSSLVTIIQYCVLLPLFRPVVLTYPDTPPDLPIPLKRAYVQIFIAFISLGTCLGVVVDIHALHAPGEADCSRVAMLYSKTRLRFCNFSISRALSSTQRKHARRPCCLTGLTLPATI